MRKGAHIQIYLSLIKDQSQRGTGVSLVELSSCKVPKSFATAEFLFFEPSLVFHHIVESFPVAYADPPIVSYSLPTFFSTPTFISSGKRDL